MSNVSKNLGLVKEKIRNACLKRPVEIQNRDVRLVAVSKTKLVEEIIEAYNCGQRHFGENYVQEIGEKGFDEKIIKACPEIKWHYIGHLQRNKVNKLLSIPNLFIVETVDTPKLADALNAGVGKIQPNFDRKLNVFIQVNTSGEDAKSGCKPDEVTDIVSHTIKNCSHLNFMGLMTIGKYNNYNPQKSINPDFETLINCQKKVCEDLDLDINKVELSMGMSGDYEHAVCVDFSLVEVGATNVRVGSLIFGERPVGYLQKKLTMNSELHEAGN